jgi:hypothetical protein
MSLLEKCGREGPTFIMISGFRCDFDEIFTLLGYYAASSGNPFNPG